MQSPNLTSDLQSVKGNEPILLHDPETVWLIQAGSMAVFTSAIEDSIPEGPRQYLFSVGLGSALFGAALEPNMITGSQRGILAVAIEETQLLRLSLAQFAEEIAQADSQAIDLMESWIQQLGTALRNQHAVLNSVTRLPGSPIQASVSRNFSLLKGQALQPPPGKVAWLKIQEGNGSWMGFETLMISPSDVWFPLSSYIWLEAIEPTEVETFPTAEISDPEQLQLSLNQLHRYTFHCLDWMEQAATQEAFQRFQDRERLNRQVTESALDELASVLESKQVGFYQEGTRLLVAAGAVGRAAGVTIRPPAKSEDPNRVKDPLEAIARASQMRIRRVVLMDKWWREEGCPLLGYTLDEKQPVALLPISGGRYELFDPETRIRAPITAEVAANLSLEAYMFYRPLPLKIKGALELFLFGIWGNERDLVWIVSLGMIGTLLAMFVPQATGILIDSAIPDSNRTLIIQLGLALFAIAVGQSAFQMAQGIMTLRIESMADINLQPAVWDRLIGLRPSFFRNYSSGDLTNRLLSIREIRGKLSGATQRTLLSSVFSLLNLGLMFGYSWRLALVGLGLGFLTTIVTIISGILIVRKSRIQQELDGAIYGLTVQLINGVAKLRVAAAEERAFAAWSRRYTQQKKLKLITKRVDDSLSVFNEALPLISSILVFWFGIMFIQMALLKGEPGLTAGSFLAFNAALTVFLKGVTDFSNTITDVLGIVPLWERAQPILQSSPEADPSKADPGRLTGRIALENVTFRYRDDGPLILEDVNLYGDPGEFIAIVGPSGSGKSTVFRLLLGFETPISGTILYDGQDLAGLDIQAVRRQLGVVLQNGRIGAGSIIDNITGGALVTLDETWEAARNAGFAEDIERMPMGMHTLISEGGTNLSGGQRQRLLIARALVLKPKVILMDEATSALDNRTQSIVTESLDRMNSTRVVIAHRLSTIRNADRIYVVEAGRVVQVGNFEELVSQEGVFARLVARQLD